MTARKAAAPGDVSDLRHYTPEELTDPEGDFRLPVSARTLRGWAYDREVDHSGMGRRITFTAADVRKLQAKFAVPAVTNRRTA